MQVRGNHKSPITSVVFSPDGEHLASASGEWMIRLWNLQGAAEQTFDGHTGAVWAMTLPGGNHLVSASSDGTVRLWGVEMGELHQTFVGRSRSVLAVSLSIVGWQLASAS